MGSLLQDRNEGLSDVMKIAMIKWIEELSTLVLPEVRQSTLVHHLGRRDVVQHLSKSKGEFGVARRNRAETSSHE